MLIKRSKLIIGIFIPFLLIFLMSHNAGALSANWLSAQTTYRWNTSGNWTSVVRSITTGPAQVAIWNSIPQSGNNYLQFRLLNISGTVSPAQTGDYYSGDFNMQLHFSGDNPNFNFTGGFNCDWIADVRIQPEVGTVVQHTDSIKACRVEQTNLDGDIYLTVSSSGKLSQSSAVSSYLIILRGLDPSGPFFSAEVSPGIHYYLTLMPGDINFTVSTNASTSGLGEVNQSINNVYNEIHQQNELENQAVDNISNQTVSDIPNATNAQTTSLLGVISSFIGALTSIDTSGNCQLTLPFPQFVGGDTIVNPCNGKDKAPAMVQVFSSLFLIGIFVPLAWLLIRMIYKEIRTWTNG